MTKPVEDIDIPMPWGHVSDGKNSIKTGSSNENYKNKRKCHRCDICNCEYICKSSLSRHMKIKHLEPTTVSSNKKIEKIQENISSKNVKNYSCDICDMKYDFRCKLLRHMKIKHNNISLCNDDNEKCASVVWHKCGDCDRSFVLWKSLLRHYRINHPGLTIPVKKGETYTKSKHGDENLTCKPCNIEFYKEEGLKNHVLKYHIDDSDKKMMPKSCECSVCSYKSVKSKALFEHYFKAHNIEIKIETLNFVNYNDFLKWKETEEKRSMNKYVTQHGPRRYKTGTEVRYFYCHRSGYYKQKGSGKRRLKQQGSKKYGKICPSRMLVKIINDRSIIVEYIVSHVGHKSEIQHLTLSHNDRLALANKIAMQMSFDDILEEVRRCEDESHSVCNDKTNCITRKDLHNIVKSFNLVPDMKKIKNEGLRFKNPAKFKRKPFKNKKNWRSTKKTAQDSVNNKTSEENNFNIVIEPSRNEEVGEMKQELYLESHELVFVHNNEITPSSGSGNIFSTIPITVAPVVPITTQLAVESTLPMPVDESLLGEQSSEKQDIIYSAVNYEEQATNVVNFKESKQNFLNELVNFVSENVNNFEELHVAKEITKSFMDAIKQNRENIIVVSADSQADISNSYHCDS